MRRRDAGNATVCDSWGRCGVGEMVLVGGVGIAMIGVVDESKIQRLEVAGAASKGQARWAVVSRNKTKGSNTECNKRGSTASEICSAAVSCMDG